MMVLLRVWASWIRRSFASELSVCAILLLNIDILLAYCRRLNGSRLVLSYGRAGPNVRPELVAHFVNCRDRVAAWSKSISSVLGSKRVRMESIMMWLSLGLNTADRFTKLFDKAFPGRLSSFNPHLVSRAHTILTRDSLKALGISSWYCFLLSCCLSLGTSSEQSLLIFYSFLHVWKRSGLMH